MKAKHLFVTHTSHRHKWDSPNFLQKSWSTIFLSLVILAYHSSFTARTSTQTLSGRPHEPRPANHTGTEQQWRFPFLCTVKASTQQTPGNPTTARPWRLSWNTVEHDRAVNLSTTPNLSPANYTPGPKAPWITPCFHQSTRTKPSDHARGYLLYDESMIIQTNECRIKVPKALYQTSHFIS